MPTPHLPLFLTLLVACDVRPGAPPLPAWEVAAARPSLAVHVTDVDGTPLDDAVVTVRPGDRDALADATGTATLHGLGVGTWDVRVDAPGHRGTHREVVVDTDTSVDVTLAPVRQGGTLSGTVAGPEGPLEGAAVTARGRTVQTDANGRFVLDALDGGPVQLLLEPPPRRTLLPRTLEAFELVPGGEVAIEATLPGRPADDASHIGSAPCVACHPTQGARWSDSAHARASRPPADPTLPDTLLAGFDGTVVPLDDLGSTVALGRSGDTWWIRVQDADGQATGQLTVTEVYGALRHGAAFAVELEDERALAPVAWAAPGGGLGSVQPGGRFLAAWTEGWLEGGLLRDGITDAASFDLRCAGCHVTGGVLTETRDGVDLVRAQDGPPEPVVGCEACHGPGSQHRRRPDRRAERIHDPGHLPRTERLAACEGCHARAEALDHPFSATPGQTTGADGRPPTPWHPVPAVPTPSLFPGVDASTVVGDQVGELRGSPHVRNDSGFAGICEDCHDPHGSSHAADLHTDPWDNRLCTTCHASAFPNASAEAHHAAHDTFATGPWEPGSCVGCHLPRAAVVVDPDVVSDVGEARSHHLWPFTPDDALASFDAAGVDRLDPGEAPVGCLDCHLQRQAAARDAGAGCPCPQGDPLRRITWQNLTPIFDELFGGRP